MKICIPAGESVDHWETDLYSERRPFSDVVLESTTDVSNSSCGGHSYLLLLQVQIVRHIRIDHGLQNICITLPELLHPFLHFRVNT